MSADSSREPRARPESPPAARPETTPDRGGADTPDSDRTDPHHPATSTALGWPDVPGYEITGEIARGGMGVVYAARDLALGREVAIKTILPSLAADPRYPAQFDREARLTALLPHPGIPPIHQVGTLPDGRPFLTMKLIKGAHPGRRTGYHRPGCQPPATARRVRTDRPSGWVCPLGQNHPSGSEAGERHGRSVRRGPGDGLGAGESSPG